MRLLLDRAPDGCTNSQELSRALRLLMTLALALKLAATAFVKRLRTMAAPERRAGRQQLLFEV